MSYLVSVNGHYLNLNQLYPDGPLLSRNYDVVFDDKTGRVLYFDKYMPVYTAKSPQEFAGYYPAKDFYFKKGKYLKGIDNDVIKKFYNKKVFLDSVARYPYLSLFDFSSDKRVFLVKREIIKTGNVYKVRIKTVDFVTNLEKLDYKDQEQIPNQIIDSAQFIESVGGHINEFDDDLANSNLNEYVQKITSQQFYNENQELQSFDANTEEVIENIVLIFHHLYSSTKFLNILNEYQLEYIFNKHFHIINNPDNYPSFKYLYNPGYFNQFRSRLLEFRAYVTAFSSNTTKSEFITYVVGLFNEDVLMHLDYQDKLDFLEDFYRVNKDIIFGYTISGRWHIGKDYKPTEEQVVVKLVKSIMKTDNNGTVLNLDDVNDFMRRLQSPIWWDTTNKKSLYELLYTTIDPDVILGGAGIKGELVKAVYSLWKVSKYNPKSNSPDLVSYDYTNYHARWRFEDEDQANQLDKTAAPLLIPYQSEKEWLWYDTNFKFKFEEGKVKALIEDNIQEASVLPLNLIDDEHGFLPYGYYHPFQPINLAKFQGETFFKIPVDLSQFDQDNLPTTPCDLDEGRGSNLPVFYLKFADDIARRKSTEETVLITIDALSIAVGGWGIYRRIIAEGGKITIRKLFTNAITWQSLSAAAKSNLTKALSSVSIVGVANVIEFTSGVLSVAHNIAEGNCTQYNDCDGNVPEPSDDPNSDYAKYQRCQAVQKWLFAVEILSLSADAFAQRFFKNATSELSNTLPSQGNNPYNNIPDVEYNNLKQKADDLAQGYADELPQFLAELDSAIVQRLNDLNLSDQKKRDFMFDFRGRQSDLDELAQNPDLISAWNEFTELLIHRKNVEVLKQYKRGLNKPWELQHIRDLHGYPVKFQLIGAHWQDTITDMLNNGTLKVFTSTDLPSGHPPTTFTTINGHLKYENLYYKRPPAISLGGIEIPPGSGNFYKKKAKQYIINPNWTEQRLKEEMAFALANKKLDTSKLPEINQPRYQQPQKHITTYWNTEFSDGTPLGLITSNYAKDPVTNTIKLDHLSLLFIK